MDSTTAGVYTDFSGLADLKLQAKSAPNQSAREVALQFESIFIGMMMEAMRNTMPEDSLFGSDQMQAYQTMVDKQVALDMANSGGIGLADMIERQIAQSAAFRAAVGGEDTD